MWWAESEYSHIPWGKIVTKHPEDEIYLES